MVANEVDSARIESPTARALDPQTIGFFLLCAYVLSQVYMVPVLVAGPSWSVWPSLADIIVPLMLLCLPFLGGDEGSAIPYIQTLKRLFLFLLAACILSYLLLTRNFLDFKTSDLLNDKGQFVGLFQLYRICQFAVVFWLSVNVNLTAKRRAALSNVVAITFWLSCLGLLANYIGVIDTSALSPQIPKDFLLAGPWAFYSRGMVGKPVGALSYHHAYPVVQLLLLSALYLHLKQSNRIFLHGIIIATVWFCSFISGSRAGFIAVCLFALATVIQKPRYVVVLTAIVVIVMLPVMFVTDDFTQVFHSPAERQVSITSSYEEDGFAGRVDIWADRLSLLSQTPIYWLVGTGFGSAIESGTNGHMLFLHITLECGLLGLMIFLLIMRKITLFLWASESGTKFLSYATGALLVSSASQETFYPVPAFGHFCGLFLLCSAVVLKNTEQTLIEPASNVIESSQCQYVSYK